MNGPPNDVSLPTYRPEAGATAVKPQRPSANTTVACALVAAAAPILVFGRSIGFGFVDWDDQANFVDNPHYRGISVDSLRWMFTTFHLGPYQPLSWLSLSLDTLIWGPGPFGHHLGNVTYHALASLAVFLLARRIAADSRVGPRWGVLVTKSFGPTPHLGGAKGEFAALAAALLFAVHPLRAESVAWATERRDVLSGLLLAACVIWYLRAQTDDRRMRRRALSCSLLLYGLSLLAKGIGMTLPVVLWLLDAGRGRRLSWREHLAEKWAFAALAAAAAGAAWYGQARHDSFAELAQVDIVGRLKVAAYGAMFYVAKSLWPSGLHAFYELPPPEVLAQVRYFAPLASVGASSIAALALRQRYPLAAAAWAAYLVLLAPVSGLAQAGMQVAADRYSYLPGMVIGLAAAALVRRGLCARPALLRVTLWSTGCAAGALGAAAFVQTGYWRDSQTLWTRVLNHEPRNMSANTNLGRVRLAQGQHEEALAHFRTALSRRPDDAEYLVNISAACILLERYDEALMALRAARTVAPNLPGVHHNFGLVLFARGRPSEAVESLQRALDLDPASTGARLALGSALAATGQVEAGEEQIREAVRRARPAPEVYADAARRLRRFGRADAARELIDQGLRRFTDSDRLRALRNEQATATRTSDDGL